ncbi:LmeA family phospholipid-binding protein [Agromyces allii]|uniref:DUF2993 domain-containing protein n=1 Tax=Agromyces allii TaxID=393607 RepID=A0ABP5BG16_9MICO|nr:DUF2993 domain-containing protein [Agromyces allii]
MSTPRDGFDETDAAGGREPDGAVVPGAASDVTVPDQAVVPDQAAPDETATDESPADGSPADEGLAPTAVLEPLSADHQPTEVIRDGVVPAAAAAASAPAAGTATEASAPVEPPAAETAQADPARRRTRRRWIIAGVVVLVIAAVLVVADLLTRSAIEQRIADEARQSLPANVQGDVDVKVGGFSVLAQLLTGSLAQITADAPELEVDGNPIDVHLVAHGVPVQQGGTIDFVEGTVTADAASVNALVDVPGVDGEIVFGDGTLGYTGRFEVLGLSIAYSVTAEAEAAGTSVVLTPVGVEIGSGDRALVLENMPSLLRNPIDVCVAKYLPAGAEVDGVDLSPGQATVSFQASDLPLGEEALQVLGTCG